MPLISRISRWTSSHAWISIGNTTYSRGRDSRKSTRSGAFPQPAKTEKMPYSAQNFRISARRQRMPSMILCIEHCFLGIHSCVIHSSNRLRYLCQSTPVFLFISVPLTSIHAPTIHMLLLWDMFKWIVWK